MPTDMEAVDRGHPSPRAGALSPAMRTFERWTVCFFAVSVGFHLFFYFVLHAHRHLVYPFSLNSRDRFADFTVFTDKFPLFHSAAFYPFGLPIIYPAPTWPLFNFFFKYAAPHEVLAFVACSALAFVVPFALFGRALARRGISPGRAALFVAVLCMLSWPVDLIVDGANIEVAVWVAMTIALGAYATGKLWWAAVFFGLAASLKLFPFIFLALFLSRRHVLKAVAGALTFLLTTLAALKFAGPTVAVAYAGYAGGMRFARSAYFTQFRFGEQGVDHSLFALYKTVCLVLVRGSSHDFTRSLPVYTLATVVGGGLLYVLRLRKLPLLNQVLALSICAIYFTPFSGDGTLVHLYYPLAMLFLLSLEAWRDGVAVPGLRLIMGCMVFCLSMESFLVVQRSQFDVRLIGPAHAIALGIMLVAALRYPLGPPLAEGLGETVLIHPVTSWLRSQPSPVK